MTTETEDYVVWSNEHSAWWRPDWCGYCEHLADAGRYTREEALDICIGARGGREFNSNPAEVPILLKDAEVFWTEKGLEEQRAHRAEKWEQELLKAEAEHGDH